MGNRELLLLVSDTHAGSDVGLCNPNTKLWDKRTHNGSRRPELTKTHRMLWDSFSKHMASASEFIGKDPVVVIHLGDATHGGVFLEDVVEPRLMGQYQIAKYNMYALVDSLENVQAIMMVDGTVVHTFGGSVEYLLADHLRDKYGFNVACYPHTLLRVGQTTHDLAHHGPKPGSRVWTKQNSARLWLQSTMIRDIMSGVTPNTATYRGHFHEWTPTVTHREVAFHDGGLQQYVSHFQFVPGYSGLSDHAVKATQSESMITIGIVVVEIIDGSMVSFHPFVDVKDTRVREEVTYE